MQYWNVLPTKNYESHDDDEVHCLLLENWLA